MKCIYVTTSGKKIDVDKIFDKVIKKLNDSDATKLKQFRKDLLNLLDKKLKESEKFSITDLFRPKGTSRKKLTVRTINAICKTFLSVLLRIDNTIKSGKTKNLDKIIMSLLNTMNNSIKAVFHSGVMKENFHFSYKGSMPKAYTFHDIVTNKKHLPVVPSNTKTPTVLPSNKTPTPNTESSSNITKYIGLGVAALGVILLIKELKR